MSIVPITWDEFYNTARAVRFQHPAALRDQVEQLKPACSDLTPYVYRHSNEGALLLCKGKMLNATPQGHPAVYFAITFRPQFPNCYPILSIEQPPPGWTIANHPHVDREGLCYLRSITQWNPRTSRVFDTCAELQQVMTERHPYERGGAPPPPQQPQRQPQQQSQIQQQQRPPQQQPVPVQQRPMPAQQPHQQQQQQQQRTGANIVGAHSDLATSVAALLFGPRPGAGASSQPPDDERQRQQRERDRAWLADQQRRNQQSQRAHEIAQQEHDAAVSFAKDRFVSILAGTTPVPPGTELATPPDFGLAGRVMTHPSGAGGPLVLTRRAAPRPLAAVTEPTPAEHFESQQLERERQQRAAQEQQAREPPPQGAMNVGLRALSRGMSALGRAATSAKSTVEEKVRQNFLAEETKRYTLLFPAAAANDPMLANYHCKFICGDGVARKGYLFITDRSLYFSSKPVEAPGQAASASTDGPALTMVAVQTYVPLNCIVSLALGSAVTSRCLHVICRDNSCRSFFDFHTTRMIEMGAYVSDAVKGQAIDRCYNWLDHKWRANVPMVPVPGYPYEQPITTPQALNTHGSPLHAQPGGAASGPLPPASAVTSNGAEVPAPGPMYQPAPNTAPSNSISNQLPTAANRETTDRMASSTGDAEEAMRCAICLDNQKNCFLRPCGHVAACMGCAVALQQCPICRAPIQDRFQAFI